MALPGAPRHLPALRSLTHRPGGSRLLPPRPPTSPSSGELRRSPDAGGEAALPGDAEDGGRGERRRQGTPPCRSRLPPFPPGVRVKVPRGRRSRAAPRRIKGSGASRRCLTGRLPPSLLHLSPGRRARPPYPRSSPRRTAHPAPRASRRPHRRRGFPGLCQHTPSGCGGREARRRRGGHLEGRARRPWWR